jgi:hydroxyacylglutathione hydrolase
MLQIDPIPAFDDNYIWLLREPPGRHAAVVDPGDADPVIERLRADDLELSAILVTHHHGDHIGGVADLLAEWPHAMVAAPLDRRIRSATRRVGEGDRVAVDGFETVFDVIEVPGHTATHIAYLSVAAEADPVPPALFCGDTLFAAGCGRVFDGTFEQLAASLRRIAELAPQTRCYCAHEYTLANLGFARWVEPDSAALAERVAEVERLRDKQLPTVPSTLAEELTTNPFLRTGDAAVIAAAETYAGRPLADATEVFIALRRWKDERYD